MLITQPAQAPYSQEVLDADFDIAVGGTILHPDESLPIKKRLQQGQQLATKLSMSYKQIDLLVRAVGVLRGTVDPHSFTPVESKHLLELADQLSEVQKEDSYGMVHGLCL